MAGHPIFDTLTLDNAPREAPSAFAQPKADPLTAPTAEPGVEVSGAIVHPDVIRPPADPGPSLESLAPAQRAPRDPRRPFEDLSLLAGPETGEHDPRTPFEFSGDPDPSPGLSSTAQFAPPDAATLVVPAATTRPAPRDARLQPGAGLAPGGPAWPGQVREPGLTPLGAQPPSTGVHEPSALRPGADAGAAGQWPESMIILSSDGTAPAPYNVGNLLRATGIGMLWCLAIGFIVEPLALIALIVAWILSMTRSRTQRSLRTGFLVALGLAAFIILAFLLSGYEQPLDAGSTAARWICLALVIACPLLTRSDLRSNGRLVTTGQAAAMSRAAATRQQPHPPGSAPQGAGPARPAPIQQPGQAPYPPLPGDRNSQRGQDGGRGPVR
ncbi:hypothetical protein [uncultured Propionibacterium sp.]|uniref:hypothetical protein n=1 Tax=uncultured Propionibacterium sp. TaxID=218066 RepID=UPI00292D259A|nr:hypothetical protein [uncultured Propionibacterium sp.]